MNDIYYIKLEYKYNTNKNWVTQIDDSSIIQGY